VFHIDEDHPEWKLMRDIGKRLTFASIFQVGAKKFRETLWDQAGIEWSFGECQNAVSGWRNTYPEFGAAYYRWLRFAEENKYVPLVNGQPSWLAGPRDYPNTAWNRRVQGSLALFANDWIVEVERATEQYDALVLTVHDSVVLDLPEEVAESVCAELVEMTESLWSAYFDIPGKCDSGLWHKG
jgi:DNA polymerase I-like protein with 3'-5' exonuclease and polymerase domains